VAYDGTVFWAFQDRWSVVPNEFILQMLIQQVNLEVERLVADSEEEEQKYLNNLRFLLGTTKFVNDVIKFFKTLMYDSTFLGRMDQDHMFLGCTNGYIDISTGKLHPHR